MPVAVSAPYSYAVPEGMPVAPGDIVEVPLGTRDVVGVVWDDPPDKEIGHNRLRPIVGKFDAPPLSKEIRAFVDWVAHYTMTTRGMVLRMVLRAPGALAPEAPVTGVRLTGPEPDRMTPARRRVLELAADGMAWSKSGLAAAAGVGTSVVKGLVESGTLGEVSMPAAPVARPPDVDYAAPVLNAEQAAAAEVLRKAAVAGRYSVTLLDGVTGSGKTEVYFEAIAEALRKGRQVLVLIPEIALTTGFLERFAARFGSRPGEWHSEVAPRVRERVWRGVADGSIKVVVGARSALFLPFADLGLIVVDEEHDLAYKQEDRVFYNARDMAVVRGHLAGFPVVLSSATPSIESRVNADAGRYTRIVLSDRYAAAKLPEIAAIDMRQHPPDRGRYLSPPLVAAVAETLAEGEQALLFLNRRGYAPLTLCRTCGHRFQCPNCSTWLVEHRFRGVLLCHHCGHSERRPDHCPNCGDTESLVAVGPGVERLGEEVAARFPDARTILMSSDIIGGVQRLREELAAIEKGEVDIVIGTQLVAKGHNFPFLTHGRRRRRRPRPRLRRHARGGADVPAPVAGDRARGTRRRGEPGAGPDLRPGKPGDPRHRLGRPRGLLREARSRRGARPACRPSVVSPASSSRVRIAPRRRAMPQPSDAPNRGRRRSACSALPKRRSRWCAAGTASASSSTRRETPTSRPTSRPGSTLRPHRAAASGCRSTSTRRVSFDGVAGRRRLTCDADTQRAQRVIHASHHAPRYPHISHRREFVLSILPQLNHHQLTAKDGRIRKGNPGDRDQPGAGPRRWTGESRVEA